MLSYIALVPGILAFMLASKHGVNYAFLRVYLPVLLLLPDYYRCIFPGLPDPTFSQGACVAVFIVFVMNGWPGYRFSINDIWVFGYALSTSFSEFRASGYSDAQNLMFGILAGGVMPYILAKSLIEPYGNRFEFAKTCVLAMSLVSIINLIETRLGFNVWRFVFDRFFPGQGASWLTTFRFGLARAAGPYAHALLAGIMMIVAFRLQRWLQWSGAWPKKIKQLPWLPFTPATWLSLITAGGLFLTLAKGSWLASFIGATITAIGRTKHRLLAVATLLIGLIVVGVPATISFINYASAGRANAKDDNQETAAYRYELIENYMEIANSHAWFGWGLTTWPKIKGSESIDNHFLLLYLMHGRVALICFLMLLFGMFFRLIIYGMRQPPQGPPGSALSFTIAGIFLAYTIAIATVFMGQQTIPMFFMLCGWAESYMQRNTREWQGDTKQATQEQQNSSEPFDFRRVL